MFFNSHVTGNVVSSAFAIEGAKGLSFPRSPTALGASMLGVAFGSRMSTQMSSHPVDHWASAAFGVDGLFLLDTALTSLELVGT
jgi:uncharacterized membrane protein YoaK (UPF0700 family)